MGLSLTEVIITPDLWVRKAHHPNVYAETAALRRLADTMTADPSKTFQVCCELALDLCRADTCGISLKEITPEGEEVFRWIALAGELKDHLHGTTPRSFSPCGICVDTSTPLLMRRPELVYTYLDVGPPFHDVLLIPLTEKNSALEGTIWIVAHNPTRKFDSEDARLMQRLAVFTATALHLANVAAEAKAAASESKLLFRQLDHRVKNTLMMAAALLRQQLGSIADPVARAAVEAARGRVLAVGQMHQIGADAQAGDLADVVRTVATDIVGSDPRLALSIDAETVLQPAHKAAVLALIVSELVTNAARHAFPDRSRGRIAITLGRSGTSITLAVDDDGRAMPADVRSRTSGIGLTLVARLADQLGGRLETASLSKRFSVTFPA